MKKERQQQPELILDEKGSLGLLAIGYKGIRAWRKKKLEIKGIKNEEEKKEGSVNRLGRS